MASTTEKTTSGGDLVKTLADTFMTGWMATETNRVKATEEVALVNRMVEVFSAYLISKFLRELEEGDSDASAGESRVRWQKVLQGKSSSHPGS